MSTLDEQPLSSLQYRYIGNGRFSSPTAYWGFAAFFLIVAIAARGDATTLVDGLAFLSASFFTALMVTFGVRVPSVTRSGAQLRIRGPFRSETVNAAEVREVRVQKAGKNATVEIVGEGVTVVPVQLPLRDAERVTADLRASLHEYRTASANAGHYRRVRADSNDEIETEELESTPEVVDQARVATDGVAEVALENDAPRESSATVG
ncbi:MAG: hypothetical protein AAF645_23255 [Myxococcota bacterium]